MFFYLYFLLFYSFFCPPFYVFHFFHNFIYLLNIFNLSFVFSTFYVSDLLFLFCFSVFSFCSIYLCIICLGSFSICRLFLFCLSFIYFYSSLSFISYMRAATLWDRMQQGVAQFKLDRHQNVEK